jgi:flavin-dependent dehydrogenase
MYDVIVVGARCAGAPTAMLLARKGYRVMLVDRSRFPSDIRHGHFIRRHGPRRLRDWGLIDRIVATGCPPATTIRLDTGELTLIGRDLVVDGVAAGYGPRRGALDLVLIEAAIAAGAELREDFTVVEYVGDGDRITGVRGGVRGAPVIERAAVIVGADGRGSALARTADAAEYEATPTLTCWYFSYWAGVDATGLELYVRRNRVIFAFPTNDGLFAVFIAWPIGEQRAIRSDIALAFAAAVELAPALAERLHNGERVEQFYGAANLPNFLRKPYGPGWALVGDAGCHKDPYLALGICDAFRDADLLAQAIDEALSGRRPFDAALADYEQQRNAATLPDYLMNLHLAQFKPPIAEERNLLAALNGNQEATNAFFMAREGMIPPETFFNPENLQRILGANAAVGT